MVLFKHVSTIMQIKMTKMQVIRNDSVVTKETSNDLRNQNNNKSTKNVVLKGTVN